MVANAWRCLRAPRTGGIDAYSIGIVELTDCEEFDGSVKKLRLPRMASVTETSLRGGW